MKQANMSYLRASRTGISGGTRGIWFAALAVLSVTTRSFAQDTVAPQPGGTFVNAVIQSNSATRIPMSHYSIGGVRGTYSGVLVGGDAFGGDQTKPVTIDAVLIPLIIPIMTTDGGPVVTFDATAPNPCDGGVSAEYRFRHSPLVVASAVTFNGVSVGNAQYIDGFMRAEFWNAPTHSRSSYSNTINWSFAHAIALGPIPFLGAVNGTGCDQTGVVLRSGFNQLLKLIIPSLQSLGVISPTKFAFFLTANVSTAATLSPAPSGFYGGQHFATGSPVQTYAWARYTHTSQQPTDVSVASHEIGEWMNDPLITNSTPAWGEEGEVENCSSKFEVGDPLNKLNMPPIKLSGYDYHVQELAFFSWFFDAEFDTSFGAGGKFSGNGKFSGPSNACPPGGTY